MVRTAACSQQPTSTKLLEQRLRLLQVGGIEALGEAAVDRREKVASFGRFALVVPEAREVARFPLLRLSRDNATWHIAMPLAGAVHSIKC